MDCAVLFRDSVAAAKPHLRFDLESLCSATTQTRGEGSESESEWRAEGSVGVAEVTEPAGALCFVSLTLQCGG